MKIVCLASDPVISTYLEQLKAVSELSIYQKQNLSAQEFVSLTKDCQILITGPEVITPLSAEVLRQLISLKFIALLTIGFNWIDMDYVRSIHLPVSTIKGATAESVAEHTWGMILNLAKRINEFDREARKGEYDFSKFKGREVFGKTLGIIGLGDIGSKVARIAQAFNMKVIGVNKSKRPANGVELVNIEELYRNADVITVCAPLNEETENLINDQAFDQMKDGVILVNCAREKIVNKEAVIDALQSNKVFGYGVETPIMQPVASNDPYYQSKNVIVVPHNGFNTVEGDIKTYQMIVENVQAFLAGKPKNLI